MTEMVRNAEELKALPQFSVVQFRGTALGGNHHVVWQLDEAWFPAGSDEFLWPDDFPTEAYPAAVVWRPS